MDDTGQASDSSAQVLGKGADLLAELEAAVQGRNRSSPEQRSREFREEVARIKADFDAKIKALKIEILKRNAATE